MTDNLSVLDTNEVPMEQLIQTSFTVKLRKGEYQLAIIDTFVENNIAFIEYEVTNPSDGTRFRLGIEYNNGIYTLENSGVFEELESAVLAKLNDEDSTPEAQVEDNKLILDGHAGYIHNEMLNDFINTNRQLRTIRSRIIAELNKWQNGITPGTPIGRYPNVVFMVIGSVNISFVRIGNALVPSGVCKSDRFHMTESSYNQVENDAHKLITNYSVEA